MHKFKVGDRVKLISKSMDGPNIGTKGVVVEDSSSPYIQFDNFSWENGSIILNGKTYSDLYAVNELDLELVTEKLEVDYILSPNNITLTFDGKVETVATSDRRYEAILAALSDGDTDAIPSLLDVAKSFNGGDYELVDGVIHIKGVAISEELTEKVLAFKDKNLPVDYLLKFAEKIEQNVSFNSRKMLYKFLEHNGHPITKDGNFIAYKMITSDFKDKYTSTIDNAVGATVTMDRSRVDDNPDNTCSSGLHVATYGYAKGFGSGHLVEIEVDPIDVVAVPKDYDGTKMRVCKYKVRRICETILEEEIYEGDTSIGEEVGTLRVIDKEGIQAGHDLTNYKDYDFIKDEDGDFLITDDVGESLWIGLNDELEYVEIL